MEDFSGVVNSDDEASPTMSEAREAINELMNHKAADEDALGESIMNEVKFRSRPK